MGTTAKPAASSETVSTPALERVLEPNKEEAMARAEGGEMSCSDILDALARTEHHPPSPAGKLKPKP